MSDKMLYNEIRAEQKFLILINAAVSHELRNPLNALVGQIESMNQYFRSFNAILKNTENDPILSNL
jgi:signal transduction histidine kinase